MQPEVAILMGSTSDLPKIQSAIETLDSFAVPRTVRVMSAHRTPAVVKEFSEQAAGNGLKVIIAAAGGAAHLAGVVASHTILPVIGIPVQGGALNGMDALLATVQMPGGIAVASVGVGRGGRVNAALLAVQILALQCPALAEKLREYRAERSTKVARADAELQESLSA